MKKLILISAVILMTFVSCDNSRIKENQEQKTPKALQEKKSYEIVSKTRFDDMIESLYQELANDTPELKYLEIEIDALSAIKSDSIKQYDRYSRANHSYYTSADNHLNQIKDSTLRNKMRCLILSSLKNYNAKVLPHTELLSSIEKKTLTLNDLHEMLIITKTLPLIEKYQNDNLPSTKSIKKYSNQLDKLVRFENILLEKNNKKGKLE